MSGKWVYWYPNDGRKIPWYVCWLENNFLTCFLRDNGTQPISLGWDISQDSYDMTVVDIFEEDNLKILLNAYRKIGVEYTVLKEDGRSVVHFGRAKLSEHCVIFGVDGKLESY